MQILLVKTSSLGDVIHNLPVVSDISQHLPSAHIDWCVEESFSAIPALHPGIRQVIPVALRRWRKNLLQPQTWQEIHRFRQHLQTHRYDWIIDTQGLIKSALISCMAHGHRAGYTRDVVREPLAALAYQSAFFVPKTLHAVERNRRLVAATLGYSVGPLRDYGLNPPVSECPAPAVIFLTATSRTRKLWPETDWIALGKALSAKGYTVILPSGTTADEQARTQRIALGIPQARTVGPLPIPALADLFQEARAVVGVDTGLTHLAAALGRTTLALYVATDPGLTGVLGSGRFCNLGNTGNSPDVATVLHTGEAMGAW